MKVLKFGGTSVGSAQRMKDVAKLICDGEQKIVVLSAMSGTTNTLVEISDYLYKKNPEGANETINKLEKKYAGVIEELYSTDEYKNKAKETLKFNFDLIRSFTKSLFTMFEEKVILAQGELMSTALVNMYLNETGVKSVMIPALDYMRIDKNGEPDTAYIKEHLPKLLEAAPDAPIYITQGFICRNPYGEIDNLKRGGSDYSASLIGGAIKAEEIQIWTDIDGMHNNDPRYVEGTAFLFFRYGYPNKTFGLSGLFFYPVLQILPGDFHLPAAPWFFTVKLTGHAFQIGSGGVSAPDLVCTCNSGRCGKIICFHWLSVLTQNLSICLLNRLCGAFLWRNILIHLIVHAVIHVRPVFLKAMLLHMYPCISPGTDRLSLQRLLFIS